MTNKITAHEPNLWITVRAPKMLYLPTMADDGGFKDSGLRIEPTDKVELKLGSNQIRVNGVDYSMLIPCDKLRIVNGVIHLDKPQAPRPLSAGGLGSAAVGRMGQAQAAARNNWDHSAFAQKTAGSIPAQYATGGSSYFQVFQDETPAFGHEVATFNQDIQSHFGKPKDILPNPVFEEDALYEEITLKDGSKARILVDPKSGKHIGTPFRMYDAQFDDEGHQLAAPAPTHGPNPTFTDADYQRAVAEQRAQACEAPGTANIYDKTPTQTTVTPPRNDPRPQAPAPPTSKGAYHTGYTHLDNLIGGWTPYYVSHLYGPTEATEALIQASEGDVCHSIEAAFGRIHLVAAQPKIEPVIFIQFSGTSPTTEQRLALAEELPVLIDMLSHMPVAVVITTPDWDETQMPALIRYHINTRIRVTTHEHDPRFLTATVTKHTTMTGKNISFPKATP